MEAVLASQPADPRLQRLLDGLTAVRGGDFSTRLPHTGDPLMDEIAAVFNSMTDQLAADRAAGTRPAAQPGPHAGLGGRKVLIVDDDLRNVFAITSVLELYGLTVVHAPSGQQGIDALRGDQDIDLVLMDVMMPEMDGYTTTTTTAAIREMPEFADLPVIAVTARAMQGDRDKSLAAGATDYVTKPVDTEELLGCIKRWLPGTPAAG